VALQNRCKIKLGFDLSECEKLEVTTKVKKKDLDAVVGNE